MPARYRLTLHNTPTSTASTYLPPTARHTDPPASPPTWCVRPRRPRPAAHSVIPRPRRRPSWLSSSFTTAGGFVLTIPQLKRRCDPRHPPAAPDHCCGASAAVKHAPTQPQAAERLQTRRTRRSRCDARNQSRLNMFAQIFTRQCYNTKSNSVTLSCVTFHAMWLAGGRRGRRGQIWSTPCPSLLRPCPHGSQGPVTSPLEPFLPPSRESLSGSSEANQEDPRRPHWRAARPCGAGGSRSREGQRGEDRAEKQDNTQWGICKAAA